MVYDLTVRFCSLYLEKRSRTVDQMVQAARSGVQNIAEGSMASGTSKKTELKLTNVARASLEELRLDYEDFLRQRELPLWNPNHPALMRFKARRCSSLEDVRAWVEEEKKREKSGQTRTNTDRQGLTHGKAGHEQRGDSSGQSMSVSACPCSSTSSPSPSVCPSSAFVANAALSLLNLCSYLLGRQIAAQAEAFEREGGFTERLYRVRSARRCNS